MSRKLNITHVYPDGSVQVNGKRLKRDTSEPLTVELLKNFHTAKITYHGDDPERLALRLIQLARVVLDDPDLVERLLLGAPKHDFLLFNFSRREEWRHHVA